MDADHLDFYGSEDDLVATFEEFAQKIKPLGKLFIKKGLPFGSQSQLHLLLSF